MVKAFFFSLTFFFLRQFGFGSNFQVSSGQTGVVEDDVITLGTRVSAWRVTTRGVWERSAGACERMRTDGGACVIEAAFVGALRGTWQRMPVFLGLKFSSFVDWGMLYRVTVSVF